MVSFLGDKTGIELPSVSIHISKILRASTKSKVISPTSLGNRRKRSYPDRIELCGDFLSFDIALKSFAPKRSANKASLREALKKPYPVVSTRREANTPRSWRLAFDALPG